MTSDVHVDEFIFLYHADQGLAVNQVVFDAILDVRITIAREPPGLPEAMHALCDQALNDGFGMIGDKSCLPSGLAEGSQSFVEVGITMNAKNHICGR